jgi:hypothetical protein
VASINEQYADNLKFATWLPKNVKNLINVELNPFETARKISRWIANDASARAVFTRGDPYHIAFSRADGGSGGIGEFVSPYRALPPGNDVAAATQYVSDAVGSLMGVSGARALADTKPMANVLFHLLSNGHFFSRYTLSVTSVGAVRTATYVLTGGQTRQTEATKIIEDVAMNSDLLLRIFKTTLVSGACLLAIGYAPPAAHLTAKVCLPSIMGLMADPQTTLPADGDYKNVKHLEAVATLANTLGSFATQTVPSSSLPLYRPLALSQ